MNTDVLAGFALGVLASMIGLYVYAYWPIDRSADASKLAKADRKKGLRATR